MASTLKYTDIVEKDVLEIDRLVLELQGDG